VALADAALSELQRQEEEKKKQLQAQLTAGAPAYGGLPSQPTEEDMERQQGFNMAQQGQAPPPTPSIPAPQTSQALPGSAPVSYSAPTTGLQQIAQAQLQQAVRTPAQSKSMEQYATVRDKLFGPIGGKGEARPATGEMQAISEYLKQNPNEFPELYEDLFRKAYTTFDQGQGPGVDTSALDTAVDIANLQNNATGGQQVPGLSGEFARRDVQLRTGLTDLQKQLQTNRNRTLEDYQTTLGRSEESLRKAAQQLQQQMSARGLSRSGINLKSSADVQKNYQDYLFDLNRTANRSLTDLIDQFSTAQRNYGSEYMGLIEGQRSYEQQQAMERARLDAEAKRLELLEQQRKDDLARIAKLTEDVRNFTIDPGRRGGYDPRGIGGGDGYGTPAPVLDSSPYSTSPDMKVALPSGQWNDSSIQQWVLTNISPSLANNSTALSAVSGALRSAGAGGLTVQQLRNLVANPYSWLEFGAL
jgi:hypothetical protein